MVLPAFAISQACFRRRIRTKFEAPDLAQEVYLRMLRVSDADAIRHPEQSLYTPAIRGSSMGTVLFVGPLAAPRCPQATGAGLRRPAPPTLLTVKLKARDFQHIIGCIVIEIRHVRIIAMLDRQVRRSSIRREYETRWLCRTILHREQLHATIALQIPVFAVTQTRENVSIGMVFDYIQIAAVRLKVEVVEGVEVAVALDETAHHHGAIIC
jgi:hypothetical protein